MNPGFRLVRLVQLFDLFRKATNMVLFCLDKFEDKTHFLIWVLKEENRNLVLEGMRTFIDCIFGKYRDHLYVLQNGFNEVRIEITPVAGQINGWSSLGEQIQESLYEIDEPWGPRSTEIRWLNFAGEISIRDCMTCLGRRVVLTPAQLFTALEFLVADQKENESRRFKNDELPEMFVRSSSGEIYHVQLKLSAQNLILVSRVSKVTDFDLALSGRLLIGPQN